MKKFLLSFLCCLLAVVSGYADKYSYTFTAKQFTADGTKTLDNVDWTLSGDGNYWGYDGTKGQQFGSGSDPYKSLTFSTSDIKGTITEIKLNTSGAKSIAGSCTVSVGGKQFGDKITLTATATEYTLEGSASGEIVLSYTQTSSKAIYIKSITIIYTPESGPSNLTPPTFTPGSCNFDNSIDVTISAESGATIYYTLDDSDPKTNGVVYADAITLTQTTTIKAIAVKTGANDSEVAEATYTKNEVVEGQVKDVLNLSFTGVSGTNYTSWSDKSATSSAVYAGQSAGDKGSIQLRSNNSNSGIVTTASGGKVKKIIVDWHSDTGAGRTLNVYGKNGAYSNPTDLYSSSTHGTKIGTIVKGTSTELEIKGEYTFIGLRSNSGAMYLNSITIIWETEEPTWGSLYYPLPVEIPSSVKAYIVTAANNSYVTLQQVTGVLPASTGVIYNGEWGSPVFTSGEFANVEGNLLKGSVEATNITEEAYVLAKVDGEVGFYKAQMNQLEGTAFKNNANKAYLPVSALPAAVQGANGFKFRFETTGVEGVQVAQGKKVIFDLSGRKVNDMTAPGVYIVNGKKVLVK